MGLVLRRLLTACALGVAFLAGGAWGHAQQIVVAPQRLVATQPVEPVVLSGADIGFRMHGRNGGHPVGTLVVRVDGEWMEVQFAFGVKPVSK